MIVKELVARLGLDIDESAFAKGDALIAGMSKGFISFGTAALGAVAVGMVAIAKSAANAADHVKKLSQSTGVNSIHLQELAYSADLAGVDIETLAHGMQRLAKSGVKDVRGEILKLAERFKKLPDDGRKVELAMEKFGRAVGPKLIPWLNAGAKGIRELSQEAHDLGIVFDTDAQDASEEFNDNITRLGYGMRGLRNLIANAVMPALNRFVLTLITFVKFVRANWTPIIDRVALALKTLAFIMAGALLAALVANAGAIALNVTWYVALGVAAAAAGVRAALAWAAAAAPVVLLAAVFAGILLVLQDVYVWLEGGDSLIGEMIPKWNRLYASMAQHSDGEPNWLWWLREAAQHTERLLFLPRMLMMLSSIKLQSDENGNLPKNYRAPAGLLGEPPPDPAAPPISMFSGGAVSPSASAAIDSRITNTTNKRSTVINNHNTHHVTVNATPGMNAQDVANKVTEQMDAHFDAQIRKAAAGVQ